MPYPSKPSWTKNYLIDIYIHKVFNKNNIILKNKDK
jgi:hypothetical protein